MPDLLSDLIFDSAKQFPARPAVSYRSATLNYAELAAEIEAVAHGLLALGLNAGERVAVYLEKRLETVAALFGASRAGGVFVPVNPLLKPEQVSYILQDCGVRILVTSADRLAALQPQLEPCGDLRWLVIVDATTVSQPGSIQVLPWPQLARPAVPEQPLPRRIDADIAAILYTSGSTGKPKGVVLSHRNMVAGAQSVAQYLENSCEDRLLAVLPLSFDYGLSQLTTAFLRGACVVLINFLLPRDVVLAVERERITGLAAVPPLWIQLAELKWSDSVSAHLRYITNSGGAMPGATLAKLRAALPQAKVFLMYGLTEAFRSTYLPPSEIDRIPGSMGKAIPNAEILVVREDGSLCDADEPGELVHRGALVSLGYWNDPLKTAERFKPAPLAHASLPLTEMAVWSGDTVRRDKDGYLYFVSRRDEMIKTSGYRVSPSEVEEVIYAIGIDGEAAALGIPHPVLGEAILVVMAARENACIDCDNVIKECKRRLPAFMVPACVRLYDGRLPRNPNGKIDRKHLAGEFNELFAEPTK